MNPDTERLGSTRWCGVVDYLLRQVNEDSLPFEMELGGVGDVQPTSDGGLYSGGYNEEGSEDHCIKGRRSSVQRLEGMGELTESFHI